MISLKKQQGWLPNVEEIYVQIRYEVSKAHIILESFIAEREHDGKGNQRSSFLSSINDSLAD